MHRSTLLSCTFLLSAAAMPGLAADSHPGQKLDALVARLERKAAPGCSLGLIRDGNLIWAKGFGLANLEHGVPIATGTVFDIGSTSKQFTAASVLLLAQEGKLSLDDDIRRLIPEIPAYGTTITVRHLLHHTSGIRDYINLLALAGINLEDVCTDADALSILGRQKALDFAPGSEHSYSNSGYFLLSILVQRASGQTLAEFARRRIFEPLGMSHTQILNEHARVIPRRASAYTELSEGGFAINLSNWEQTGDGAVQTTVEDLVLWDRNFYDPKVGGSELIRELQVTGTLNDGTALDYARGLQVGTHRGLRVVEHAGAWAGFRAQMVRFPEQRVSAIALCNFSESDPSQIAFEMAEIALEDELEPANRAVESPAASSPASASFNPAEAVGLYFSEPSNLVRRVLTRDGRLFYNRGGENESELLPDGPNRFSMAGVPNPTSVTFATEPGQTRRMEVRSGGAAATRFLEVQPAGADAGDLTLLTGRYYSEELDTTWTLTVDQGALSVAGKRGPGMRLDTSFKDAFTSPVGLLRLHRNEQGRVTGFEISVGRARRIGFERL